MEYLVHSQAKMIKTLSTQQNYPACSEFTNRRGANQGRGHAMVAGVAVAPDLLDALDLGERATDPMGFQSIKATLAATVPKANAAALVPNKAGSTAEINRIINTPTFLVQATEPCVVCLVVQGCLNMFASTAHLVILCCHFPISH